MIHSFEFQGNCVIKPITGQEVPSASLSNAMKKIVCSLSKYSYQTITGDGTANDPIGMGQVENCKILIIQKPNQSYMKLRVTHADGTNQVIPVGKLLVLECSEKPITAIDYTFTGDFEITLGEWLKWLIQRK